MMDRFEEALKALGVEWDLPLHPDHNRACLLRMGESCSLQIEYNKSQESLLVAAFIAETPPGKFRENLFKTALKLNHQAPQTARLSYSDKNNQLALYQQIPLENLSGKALSDLLNQFTEKVVAWKRGVDTGDLAALFSSSSKGTPGIFGLQR